MVFVFVLIKLIIKVHIAKNSSKAEVFSVVLLFYQFTLIGRTRHTNCGTS